MKEPTKAESPSTSPSGLPEDFLVALEAEYTAEADRLEKLYNQRIGELILSRRNDATSLFLQAEAEYSRALRNAENELERSLRTIDNDGAHQMTQIRMQRLEKEVYELLQGQRKGDQYPPVVVELAKSAQEAAGTVQKFCAPEPEASILRKVFPDVEICLTPENHWGGFILIGKGGTVLDSTFRTRWQALQKMASAEFSAEL